MIYLSLDKEIEILNMVESYFDKHELAIKAGAEYVQQSDTARIDAIELVSDIAEFLSNGK